MDEVGWGVSEVPGGSALQIERAARTTSHWSHTHGDCRVHPPSWLADAATQNGFPRWCMQYMHERCVEFEQQHFRAE